MRHNLVYLIDGMGMGGAEKLLTQIVTRIDRHIFTTRVCILQEKGESALTDELRMQNVAVDILDVRKLTQANALPRVIASLRTSGSTLLHTQLQHADILGGIAARVLKIPCLSTIHTLVASESSPKKRLKQRLEWFVHRHCCAKILTVSEASRRNYLSCNDSCPPGRVTTLHNGIDLDRFPARRFSQRPSLKASLGLEPDRPVITTIAVLRQEKGIQFALEALPRIIEDFPKVLYLIVGDGPYRQTLAAMVAEKGLQKNVLFTGQRADIPAILAGSDVFLLPTLSEALPTVLAEAMAAERPVIASTVGGVPEMISAGDNGLLVPPACGREIASACLELIADPAKAERMGKAGGKMARRHFNISRQVRKLESIYLGILDNNGGTGEDNRS